MPATVVVAAAVVAAQVLDASSCMGGRLCAVLWTCACLCSWVVIGWVREGAVSRSRVVTLVIAAVLALVATRPLEPPRGSVGDLTSRPNATQPRTHRWVADLIEPPRFAETGLRAVVEARAWLDGDRWRPAFGRIRLAIRHATPSNWHPGMRIVFDATLRPIENFGNPGEFDWRGWNARRGVFVSAFVWDERAIERAVLANGGGLRARFREAVYQQSTAVGGSGGALVAAMIVGDRRGLDEPTSEALRAAGLAHLLAISGFHMAAVAGLFLWLMRPRVGAVLFGSRGIDAGRVAATGAAAAVLLYAALSGGGISVARATIMSLAALAVLWRGGRGRPWRSLAAAATFIALAKPGVVQESGFELSFAATAVLLARLSRQGGARNPGTVFSGIRETAAICMYCSIVTWPIVAHHFYRLPVYAPVVNLAAAVPAALTIGLGIAAAAVLPVSSTLSSALFTAASAFGGGVVGLAQAVSRLPGTPLRVVDPGETLCWALVATVLIVARRPRNRRRLVMLAGGIAVVAVAHGAWVRWRSDRLDAVFLSVGHGDASIVRLPGGRTVVIDGGGYGRGRWAVGPMLRRMQIGRIDYLIVSHVQSDHWPGAVELARDFEIGELWYSGGDCRTREFRSALAALRGAGTKLLEVSGGARAGTVRAGPEGWRMQVLWPADDRGRCDDNDRSVVLAISFAGRRLLWTGDVEAEAERSLVARVGAADVLKVAHHGSSTSSSPAFVAAVRPRYAVVSVGRHGRFGLPDRTVLDRLAAAGATILRTDRNGAIAVTVTTDDLTVHPAKRF